MIRPSRYELVQKAFPELKRSIGSKGDKEAAIGLNTRAAEAVLQDMIGLFDAGFSQLGPGVLAVRLSKDEQKTSDFLAVSDIRADAENALNWGDIEISEAMGDVASVVEAANVEKVALILLMDNSGFRLLPVERDNPARVLTAVMEELQE